MTTMLVDDEEDIQRWLQEERSAHTDRVARFAKPFGDGRYTIPVMAALYCGGHLFGSERAKRTALMGVESFVITGIFTEAIKHISHKHRPASGDLENILWDGPGLTRANLSFPSGHAASAFAVATVVATQYRETVIVPPLAYGAAAMCAYSRLNDNAHWMSDVLLGSAIGYFTAKAVTGLHGSDTYRPKGNFDLAPVVNGRYAGLSLSYSF
jgi:membrane-associated phospholipid phosphatase